MSMTPEDYLAHNLALLGEMKDLVERQISLIRQDRPEMTFALAARSRKLEHQVSENTRRCELLLGDRPVQAKHQRLQALLVETQKAMKVVLGLNREMEALLLKEREMLLSEILKLRKGHKALQGYGAGIQRRPRFIETQG